MNKKSRIITYLLCLLLVLSLSAVPTFADENPVEPVIVTETMTGNTRSLHRLRVLRFDKGAVFGIPSYDFVHNINTNQHNSLEGIEVSLYHVKQPWNAFTYDLLAHNEVAEQTSYRMSHTFFPVEGAEVKDNPAVYVQSSPDLEFEETGRNNAGEVLGYRLNGSTNHTIYVLMSELGPANECVVMQVTYNRPYGGMMTTKEYLPVLLDGGREYVENFVRSNFFPHETFTRPQGAFRLPSNTEFDETFGIFSEIVKRDEPSGTYVADFWGQVRIIVYDEEYGYDEYTPVEGHPIPAGAYIITDERSGLTFNVEHDRHLHFELGPNSIYQFPKQPEGQTKLEVLYGHLVDVFTQLRNTGTYSVEMSQAAAGRKATIYQLYETGAESSVVVYEGVVTFTNRNTGESIDIVAGQQGVADYYGTVVREVSLAEELEKLDERSRERISEGLAEKSIDVAAFDASRNIDTSVNLGTLTSNPQSSGISNTLVMVFGVIFVFIIAAIVVLLKKKKG